MCRGILEYSLARGTYKELRRELHFTGDERRRIGEWSGQTMILMPSDAFSWHG